MKYIIDYIVVFFDWIIALVTDVALLIWNLVLILVECGKFLISIISSLPTLVIVPAVAVVVCCIIYKIIGREGGESS